VGFPPGWATAGTVATRVVRTVMVARRRRRVIGLLRTVGWTGRRGEFGGIVTDGSGIASPRRPVTQRGAMRLGRGAWSSGMGAGDAAPTALPSSIAWSFHCMPSQTHTTSPILHDAIPVGSDFVGGAEAMPGGAEVG